MERITIDTAIWKSKDGFINIGKMTNDHLQKAYNSAEYRFMKYENLAVSALFEQKLKQLENEANARQIGLSSVSNKNKEKFDILRNRKRVLAME